MKVQAAQWIATFGSQGEAVSSSLDRYRVWATKEQNLNSGVWELALESDRARSSSLQPVQPSFSLKPSHRLANQARWSLIQANATSSTLNAAVSLKRLEWETA